MTRKTAQGVLETRRKKHARPRQIKGTLLSVLTQLQEIAPIRVSLARSNGPLFLAAPAEASAYPHEDKPTYYELVLHGWDHIGTAFLPEHDTYR